MDLGAKKRVHRLTTWVVVSGRAGRGEQRGGHAVLLAGIADGVLMPVHTVASAAVEVADAGTARVGAVGDGAVRRGPAHLHAVLRHHGHDVDAPDRAHLGRDGGGQAREVLDRGTEGARDERVAVALAPREAVDRDEIGRRR